MFRKVRVDKYQISFLTENYGLSVRWQLKTDMLLAERVWKKSHQIDFSSTSIFATYIDAVSWNSGTSNRVPLSTRNCGLSHRYIDVSL